MNKGLRQLVKPWFVTSGLIAWSLFFAACMSTQGGSTAPAPTLAGATFVGSKECATCHEEKSKGFEHASHARLSVVAPDGKDVSSCEACHGPASLHVKLGDGKNIINPKNDPETCFKCHLEKRGEFSLPNAHQVLNGKMSCGDCHDVHEGNAIKGSGAATLEAENETCLKCHTAQKGPYVFPHQAMREGCVACHNPHGSVNKKMLAQRDANLCTKCHLETPTTAGTIVVGGANHNSRMGNADCWTAGCHEAVHGSNAHRALRY